MSLPSQLKNAFLNNQLTTELEESIGEWIFYHSSKVPRCIALFKAPINKPIIRRLAKKTYISKHRYFNTARFGLITLDEASKRIEQECLHEISRTATKKHAIKKVSVSYSIDRLSSTNRGFPPTLRLLIFQRDNFKCVYCGNGPHNGYEIEADHIIEWEDGGETSYNNGQTLCRECNSGKYHVKNIKRKAGVE